MAEELAPCPLCGGAVRIEPGEVWGSTVVCNHTGCGWSFAPYDNERSVTALAAAWNTARKQPGAVPTSGLPDAV